MINIGGLKIENEVFLAPMAGVTDSAFRRICRENGCGFVYTEMVSAKALWYNDKKTERIMCAREEEKPFAVQIFGSDPKIMGEIAKKAASTGAALLDINMGCPAPKIANNGDGSALMKNPELVFRITESVCAESPVPVTVKIRKGWDENNANAVEVARAAQSGGASAVCVHPRFREQYYRGRADWQVICDVKKALKVPVIGNGDIFCAEDALEMKKQTGCDAVMIGRGAQGNPFIFRQIAELMKYGEVKFVPALKDKTDTLLRQLDYMIEDKGEYVAVREARKHAAWYLKGERNSAFAKAKINCADTKEELLHILNSLL